MVIVIVVLCGVVVVTVDEVTPLVALLVCAISVVTVVPSLVVPSNLVVVTVVPSAVAVD